MWMDVSSTRLPWMLRIWQLKATRPARWCCSRTTTRKSPSFWSSKTIPDMRLQARTAPSIETRFYLIGMIDPADKKEEGKDYTNRVFTQDYTTTMSMSVTSLAKAYTCMPDLLAPRLEVGVQVVTKWIQATTTNVELR